MGMIVMITLAVMGVLGAVLSRQLADEFKAWTPWLIERLVQRAIQNLPSDQRDRFEEEWRSDINETPGEIGKLFVAVGMVIASRTMALELVGAKRSVRGDFAKRVFDIVVSAATLAFMGPTFAFSVLAIFISDGRPIFYRQERIGLNGRPFLLLKFRTMAINAEGEPEVTGVGRFLRASRIDEIPQLLNVLRGDMTYIGPRPEKPFFIEELSKVIPRYNERHLLKPGITGWAQVNHPSGGSLEDARAKLSYDLYYLKNRSLWLDLLIMVATVEVVLWPWSLKRKFTDRDPRADS